MKVLIVDDDRALCRSLQIHLEREGHRVSTALSGDEALSAFESHPVDLVLLDVQLPDFSGLDVWRRLRRRQPNCLAVIITGTDIGQDVVSASGPAAFGFMRKPLDLEVLFETLGRASRFHAEAQEGRFAPPLGAVVQPPEVGQ